MVYLYSSPLNKNAHIQQYVLIPLPIKILQPQMLRVSFYRVVFFFLLSVSPTCR